MIYKQNINRYTVLEIGRKQIYSGKNLLCLYINNVYIFWIAFRCYAALKDVSKVKSLQRINEMASGDNGLGYHHYKVRAKLAILDKQFKQAESIYLEQVLIECRYIFYLFI